MTTLSRKDVLAAGREKRKRDKKVRSERRRTSIFRGAKLTNHSNDWVQKAMPMIKQIDHEHTDHDLHQAAMELWARYHRNKTKLSKLLLDPAKLEDEIRSILPPTLKVPGFTDMIVEARHHLNVKLHQTYIGLAWEALIMFFSAVTIINYIAETYAETIDYGPLFTQTIIAIDIFCNSLFALDFVLNTMTFYPWYGHVQTLDGLVDFITVIPFVLSLSTYGLHKFPTFSCHLPGNHPMDESTGCVAHFAPAVDPAGVITFLRFTRILKNIRLLREARLVKIFRNMLHVDMAKARLISMAVGILGVFTLSTSVIYLIENEIENYLLAYSPQVDNFRECYSHDNPRDSSCGLTWIQSLYMLVVTFTTVGYGDFSPKSTPAQLSMIIILLLGVAWLSNQIGRVNAVLAEVPKHKSKYKYNEQTGHICLLGGFARQTLLSFLEEHFHPDHRTPGSKLDAENVVIMQPQPAPGWLRHLIVHHDHASQLHFFHGSIYSKEDLRAIQLHKAAHCFIFANVHSKNFVKDDANAVVHATALKSWTEAVDNPPPLHIQVHLESTRRRLARLSRNRGMHDIAVDIDGLKARIFGHNFMCPGASTFLENLFTSFAMPAGMVHTSTNHHPDGDENVDESEQEWLEEYYHGCGQELYTTKSPTCLDGTLFSDAVIAVYLGHIKSSDSDTSRSPDGVIVVGVVEHPHLTTSGRRVLMNPGDNYHIKPHSHLIVIADDDKKAKALEYAHNMPAFCKAGGMVLYALASRRRSKSGLSLSKSLVNITDENFQQSEDHIEIRKGESFSKKVGVDGEDSVAKVQPNEEVEMLRRLSQSGRAMFSHRNLTISKDGQDVLPAPEEEEASVKTPHVQHLLSRMDDMHEKIAALLPSMHLTSTGGSLDMWRRMDGENSGRVTEWPELEDHIIVCGDLRRLPEFVSTIREGIPCHLGDHQAIVEVPIVCLSPLDDVTANQLWGMTTGVHDPEVMYDVFHARGDPSNDNDLRSVSLETASCVLILGNAEKEDRSDENERNIESSVLTAYFAIQTELAFMPHRHVRVAVETQWSMAMTMLDNMRQMFHHHRSSNKSRGFARNDSSIKSDGLDTHDEAYLERADAEAEKEAERQKRKKNQGCCSISHWFDKHHQHRKLQKKRNDRYNFMAGPLYAAGGAISARFFDTFLAQTMFTPEVLDFLFACVSFREDHESKGIGDRALMQLEIMPHLSGKPFQQLFSLMLKKFGLLAVALYRSHRSCVKRRDGLPFVLTSPPPDTAVRKDDRVFVLATFPLMPGAAVMCDQYSSAREIFSSAESYKHERKKALTHVQRVERKKSLYHLAKDSGILGFSSKKLVGIARTFSMEGDLTKKRVEGASLAQSKASD